MTIVATRIDVPPRIHAEMTGSTQDDYANMMLAGGRPVDGNRSRSGKFEKPASMVAQTSTKTAAKKAKPKAAKAKMGAKAAAAEKSRSKRG